MSNLIRICRPKLKFRTRFRKFGSIHEYRDHKKALLNGKYGQKVKDGIFRPKNAVFGFWAKNQKLRPFFISKKSQLSESGVRFQICYRTETQNNIFKALFGQF